jgi:2-polyprenyl-3-methyl-5-hydroxy-6-metoxy-1,4-benzoquinol methylase
VGDDWWKPQNLAENEAKHRNSRNVDVINAFGSYRVMVETDQPKKAQISQHNDMRPSYRTRLVKKLIGPLQIGSILDVGCGIGITTESLREVFKSTSVTGIDISRDAIKYATSKHRECNFICDSIDPESGKTYDFFDLICAFEFYPFTRTSDYETHKSYIEYLVSFLKPEGRLVIWQRWDNQESLSTNFDKIQNELTDYQFSSFRLPLTIVAKIFPFGYRVNILISRFVRVGLILLRISNRDIGTSHCLIISR